MTIEADPHAPPARVGAGLLTTPSIAETLALALQGTSVLFANGETTERTIAAGERMAGVHGYRPAVVARWDGLTVRLQGEAGARHDIVPVTPTGIDMHKVMEAERAVDAICARAVTPEEAGARFARTAALPPVSLARFAIAAAVGAEDDAQRSGTSSARRRHSSRCAPAWCSSLARIS